MKQVKVTILVDIDQDVYEDFIAMKFDQAEMLKDIKLNFNSAKVDTGLIENFEVESVEVK
jgi:hypothetical protein